MDVEGWLNTFSAIAVKNFQSSTAVALVNFVRRYANGTATFVEGRSNGVFELVLLDVQTGRPQQPVYNVNHVERIAVRFAAGDGMPIAFILRNDFPDTPHQLLTPEGMPRAICVDDRTWAEARLTWTPAELIERTLKWFERAAHGKLHDARQPLDPLMFTSGLSFIVSRRDLAESENLDLFAEHDPKFQRILRIKRVEEVQGSLENQEPIALMAYRIMPEEMKRLTIAPTNFGSLAEMLMARKVDLFGDLQSRFRKWLQQGKASAWRLSSRFGVIVEMPIMAPSGDLQHGTDLRAFLTKKSAGTIASALGIAEPVPNGVVSKVGFVELINQGDIDKDAIYEIVIQPAEIHYEFDRQLATLLSRRAKPDERKVVLVGAGAIGSHLAECLVREGRFRWTIIDDDQLLPHNLARHTTRKAEVSKAKAELIAGAINATIDSQTPIAKALVTNVMSKGKVRSKIDEALNDADLIFDATASMQAFRYLSDHPSKATRASAFFNPAGTAGVLLVEPEDRKLTLRDLEAQYYALIIDDNQLEDHLTSSEKNFIYTGACRAITNLIPESNIMTLSGLLAGSLGKAVDEVGAVLNVLSLKGSGAIEVSATEPAFMARVNTNLWKIAIDRNFINRIHAMRNQKLPNETGGVLTGVVDIPSKYIHLVGAAPAPEDSSEMPDEFIRGTSGVRDYLDSVFTRTSGQVRYIGEWHSHPPLSRACPSATDLEQIDWLSSLFDLDTLPALMLIVGECDFTVVFGKNKAVSC